MNPDPAPGPEPSLESPARLESLARMVAEHEAGIGPAPPQGPRTERVRLALRATGAELAALSGSALPADVAARWAGALATMPARTGRRRHRNALLVAALVAAVLMLTAALGIGLVRPVSPVAGRPTAGRTDGVASPLALAPGDLAAATPAALAAHDLGPLADTALLARCLGGLGLPLTSPVGGRRVLLDGRSGILLVLPTGVAGRLRLVVVTPDCGGGESGLLADTTVGR